ncbi:hypothetical protein [Paraburkholderia acidiphila]|uniref:HAD-IIIC family phosphatase n=1 Tax=Paraburkholderia acidiphila TaxID=2571747 RepID=A0A7Z2G9H9_9BURK|nr:hypothetical protein [Paraburkholderia acidiphila]QGZ57557.1 hypothetical protein FAZ97_21895 [Paraburkholderia acidiphila]
MAEDIRLVVWDLDETFWKGTLTEGGIEYVDSHHAIVVELARRGIMSSVCSKNDPDPVMKILDERGASRYFIFPDISWNPKGPRLKDLIARVQLRPETVLFIDDNPSNRSEALAMVPGIQVADERIIGTLLSNPRTQGKDDSSFSRLQQYKSLEKKAQDQKTSGGSNEAFLRASHIRVEIDYDVEAHIERAIELINRTNQLNFTKLRLPEDLAAAKRELREQICPFDRHAGVVRVVDNYGDYGIIGFFLVDANKATKGDTVNASLVHFCFSCRTLGMGVEKWVYEKLGRPDLTVVGDVVSDLFGSEPIDWINQDGAVGSDRPADGGQKLESVVVYGGCEAEPLALYMKALSRQVRSIGHFAAGGLYLRMNSARVALGVLNRTEHEFASDAQAMGLPQKILCDNFFAAATAGTVFVFNFNIDINPHYALRHKKFGWELLVEPRFLPHTSLLGLSEEACRAHMEQCAGAYSADMQEQVVAAWQYAMETYEVVLKDSQLEHIADLRCLLDSIPQHCKAVVVVNHDKVRSSMSGENTVSNPAVLSYLAAVRELTSRYDYAAVVSVSEIIEDVSDLQEGGHYARHVYQKVARRIAELTRLSVGRTEPPVRQPWIDARHQFYLDAAGAKQSAATAVDAAYQALLGRAPDADARARAIDELVSKRLRFEDLLKAILNSGEFAQRRLTSV